MCVAHSIRFDSEQIVLMTLQLYFSYVVMKWYPALPAHKFEDEVCDGGGREAVHDEGFRPAREDVQEHHHVTYRVPTLVWS